MNAPQYQRYPMVMKHPGERPAVISQWVWDPVPAGGVPTTGRHVPEHGEPARFQPVTVNNADDEEYHAAQGYRPLGGDAQAFTQQVNDNIVNRKPPGYAFSEYPKWVDGVLVQDPGKPQTNFQEYPKWVGDVLVTSAAQEAAMKLKAETPPAPYVAEPPAAPAMCEVIVNGVAYQVPAAVAAQMQPTQEPPAQSAQPDQPASKKRASRAPKAESSEGEEPVKSRRSYRDRTGALASSADAVA